jgi:hypothetical protein
MKGYGAKYDRKKEEAIAALLTQKNIEERPARSESAMPRSCAGSRSLNSIRPIGKLVGLHSASQSPGPF